MRRSIDLENVTLRYDALLDRYSDDSRAVGWRDAQSQASKFYEIAQVFAHEKRSFTVYDVGCGLGNLYDFLKDTNRFARYHGCDINPRMIERARRRHGKLAVDCRDILLAPPRKRYDYVLASGTFNLRMNNSEPAWQKYVERMLRALYGISRHGIAVGFLSTFARHEERDEFHENPSRILDFVQRALSPLAEIRHSASPGHFAVFAYRSLPLKRISRLRGPSLKSKSMIERRGIKSP